MKLISWNVNGLRACMRKGFIDYFNKINADIFCLQEIRLQEGQIDFWSQGYYCYWNYGFRKGYSGVAVFTKLKPLHVTYDFNEDSLHPEGRIITLEFDGFFLITIYTPNTRRDLSQMDVRLQWEDKLYTHIQKCDRQKPVILCGDLNVARSDIDVRNAKQNRGNSGFTTEERGCLEKILNSGFTDTLRYFYPDSEGLYTWWSYMKTVRARNIGWRIDYFLASKKLISILKDAGVEQDVYGSDHCPIRLEIDV